MMGVANGLPEIRVNPMDDQFIVGRQLWSVIDPMITAFIECKFDYIFEGVQLVPRLVHQLTERFNDHIVACFIGYAEVSAEEKASDLIKYSSSPDDWTRDYVHGNLVQEAEQLKYLSVRIRDECAKYQLTYFDSSHDFTGTVESVLSFLRK